MCSTAAGIPLAYKHTQYLFIKEYMIPFREVRMIWEKDFSELVSETYGRPYRLQQGSSSPEDYMSQGSIRELNLPEPAIDGEAQEAFVSWCEADATPPGPEDNMEQWEFRLMWERAENGLYAPLEVLGNDLLARGLLEPGDYIIHCWW